MYYPITLSRLLQKYQPKDTKSWKNYMLHQNVLNTSYSLKIWTFNLKVNPKNVKPTNVILSHFKQ